MCYSVMLPAQIPKLTHTCTHLINKETWFRHFKNIKEVFPPFDLILNVLQMCLLELLLLLYQFLSISECIFSHCRFLFTLLYSLLTLSAELWSTPSFLNESALPGCVYLLTCAVTFMLMCLPCLGSERKKASFETEYSGPCWEEAYFSIGSMTETEHGAKKKGIPILCWTNNRWFMN